jgi:hypothetical protein
MNIQSCPESDNENNNEFRFSFSKLDDLTRQTIIEETFEQKKLTGMKLGKAYKFLIERYGKGFISKAQFYRLWEKYIKNPDTAGLDGRSANKGLAKPLEGDEKAAWEPMFM